MVVDVAHAVTQSPGAVEVQCEHPAERVALGGDEGIGGLEFARGRASLARAERVRVGEHLGAGFDAGDGVAPVEGREASPDHRVEIWVDRLLHDEAAAPLRGKP